MAITIPGLPAASAAQLTDLKEISQSGVSKKVSTQQDLTLFNANAQLAATSQVTGLVTALAGKADLVLSNLSNYQTARSNLKVNDTSDRTTYRELTDNTTMTNPLADFIDADFTVPGKTLTLPPMNASNSIGLGNSSRVIRIRNLEANTYDIKDDGGHIKVHGLPQYYVAVIYVTENSDNDGNLFISIQPDWNDVSNPLAIKYGGTGADSAAGALTSLGALPLNGGTMTGSLEAAEDIGIEYLNTTEDYNPSPLNYFEERSIELTLGGAIADATFTGKFRRIGNTRVELSLPNVAYNTATSSSFLVISGIPVRFFPQGDLENSLAFVQRNGDNTGSYGIGATQFDSGSGGLLRIFADTEYTTFTSGNSIGITACSISYGIT